jgi:hypothetical protein
VVVNAAFTSPLLVYALRASEFRPLLQHAIQDCEHQVCDGNYGPLFSPAWRQLLKSDGKHRALFARGCPGTLNQGHAKIGIQMGSLTTFLNTCAFPIPGTQTCPTRYLLRCRKW